MAKAAAEFLSRRQAGPAAGTAIAVPLLAVLALVFAGAAGAQTLYRYQSADGQTVYSDRQPSAIGSPATREADPVPRGTGVVLREGRSRDGEVLLVAVNALPAWIQIAFRVESARNLDPDAPTAGNRLLPPSSETELMALPPIDGAAPAEVAFSYQYIFGHPGAEHAPKQAYRLPYALDSAFTISQAFPGALTHGDAANEYAVDFEMPIGTPVYAAREGIVVEIASGFEGAGLDFEHDRSRANYVRIMHADGTFALYGHLAPDSIRVATGQEISRGARIADSGNTGYSSGPHLHFVVQRNRAGAVESVPVSFAGAGGRAYTPATGDRLVAY